MVGQRRVTTHGVQNKETNAPRSRDSSRYEQQGRTGPAHGGATIVEYRTGWYCITVESWFHSTRGSGAGIPGGVNSTPNCGMKKN